MSHSGLWWEGTPGRGKSWCKGPEVGACQVCLRDWGWPEQVEQGRVGRDGVRGVHKVGTDRRGPFLVRTRLLL